MKNKAAQELGSIKTLKKAAASRQNGAKGGRPILLPEMVEETALGGQSIYSQIWRRGKQWAHVVFYNRDGETRKDDYCARGNTPEAVHCVAKYTTEANARQSHAEFCDGRI